MKKTLSNKGFTKVILIAIVIIGALAYYNIDLRAILEKIFTSPLFQTIWEFLKNIWFEYLAPIWTFIKGNLEGLFS
ncbi:MAG: hypothetical protein AAB552_00810 [Patescibacteria group bacterium]